MSRPGDLAHLLGVAGYALMLWCAFGYTWRKRLTSRGPGPTRAWMRAHVAAGLAGPALVLVHTGGAFRGLAGVTMGLTLVVVASGLVGRYVYAAVPPLPEPDDEVARIDAELAELAAAPNDVEDDRGGTATLAPRRVQRVERAVLEARIRTLRELRAAHERRHARAIASARWRRRLAVWWVLHVPLGMAVLALALVHSIAALYYGARWR